MGGTDERDADLERAIEKWRGQSRKGFLELCLLEAVEGGGRIYGFALMELLGRAGLDIGEGSLYPLLARMVREGTLEAEWESPSEGHPRKYYRVSGFGRRFLARLREERSGDQAAYQALLALGKGGSDVRHS
ncbi:MAG: PadR family transcriptional regulator [Spirochaetes bacterium]|nr:PadR family transcriptional regulator [Spirochaetota bacterium]